MRHNADAICYFPFPFHRELHYPNERRVIPNVTTDIIPFIFPLYRFASVDDYMVHAVRPGQRHFVVEERIQCSRRISLRNLVYGNDGLMIFRDVGCQPILQLSPVL